MQFDSNILQKNYNEKLEQSRGIFKNYCDNNISSIIERAMNI